MATYKVIQDIEAEDKLVGPLTLRQFIYAGVAAVCLYVCFLALSRNAQFLIAIFLPIAVLAGFFAFPWKGEQPTEIWALARLRFAIKPRVRVWDQDGARDLVSITVPKKIETARPVRNLSQTEVRSRLKALADTIDSRGWATRNAAYAQTIPHPTVVPSVPNTGGLTVSMPSDDMFDNQNSVAQNLDAMLARSSQENRQRIIQEMSQATQQQQPVPAEQFQAAYQQPAVVPAPQFTQAFQQAPQLPAPVVPQAYGTQYSQPPAVQLAPPPADYWFANGPAYPANPAPQPVQQPVAGQLPGNIESDVPLPSAAAPTAEEAALAQTLKQQSDEAMRINYARMRVLQPIGANPSDTGSTDYPAPADDAVDTPLIQPVAASLQQAAAAPQQPQPAMTRETDPAILELANNDDLDIATIARQAKKEIQKAPDEVEIRLH